MFEQNDREMYTDYMLSAHRDYVNSYNDTVRNFIRSHFILNAGAVSILAVYFLDKGYNVPYLLWSLLFFLLGTMVSLLAMLLDFFWGFFSLNNFSKHFFKPFEADLEVLKKTIDRYNMYQKNNKNRSKASIIIRIFNGIFSYALFLIGIFIIIFNKIPCSYTTLFVLLPLGVLVYGILLIIYIEKCVSKETVVS